MISVWSDTSKLPRFDDLKKDIKTDVLIIGGGMAGLLLAYLLKQSKVDYALVEASTIMSGITKNTTAKITSQHGLIYDKLIGRFGVERARMYLMANQSALTKYREICRDIDCGFEERDAFVYSLDDREKLEREMAALERIGFRAQLEQRIPLPFPVAGAVRFKGQAQFNPLKFAASIAEGLNIYEHTAVRELAPRTAITDKARIAAKKIVIATHFPILNKHGLYFLKMYQHRSYVLALGNAPQLNGMYIDEAETGMSFRNYEDLLLIGGGGHRTGKRGGKWEELEAFARAYYPDAKERYRWATQDCMTLDQVPYIGRYAKGAYGLYVATGFNKWGMTSSMVAAMILKDMAIDRDNPYAPVFYPSRTILRPQLAVNAFEAIVNLLTISQKRCPHVGCALKWNPEERSWDCPCHGSRFTEDGTLIDNPATGNLRDVDDRPHRQG